MSFRLIPKSVTLNDIKRRNGRCVISQNSIATGAHCVKLVEGVVVKTFTFAMSSPDEFLVMTVIVSNVVAGVLRSLSTTAEFLISL